MKVYSSIFDDSFVPDGPARQSPVGDPFEAPVVLQSPLPLPPPLFVGRFIHQQILGCFSP